MYGVGRLPEILNPDKSWQLQIRFFLIKKIKIFNKFIKKKKKIFI